MNRKVIKIIIGILLCLCIALSFLAPAFAAGTTVVLETADDILRLAENCRTDTYSRNITVELKCDIDLSGVEFNGIPMFSGIFNGNGYTISGVSVTSEGSAQGFFRYVQETGEVHDLNIKGDVKPGGSKNTVGGIAGENSGKIENCSFEGSVAGADRVGGIVGINKLSGIINGCQVHGSVTGNHFTGGVAGENTGVVRNSKNAAGVNITAVENRVELSEITLDSLYNSEAANTVTDIGGIAGISTGVIRACANYGDVGYKLMGYNVGGIAGTQAGYMTGCTNHGDIAGRKDVGGIVGHMEPVTSVEYTEDTIQALGDEMDTLGGLTNQLSANAQSGAHEVMSQVAALEDYAESAKEALKMLSPEDGELPDLDTILVAQNALSESLSAMPGTVDSITQAVGDTVYGISQDLQSVQDQVGVMGGIIGSAEENMGIIVTDISDEDTENALTGKVENCTNNGAVSGDGYVGGVVGTIGYENDLDTQEDVDVYGQFSLNTAGKIRAVLLNCTNRGEVSLSKQYGGGAVGMQLLGLVKGCISTGSVNAEKASYIGGIAGLSQGFIRQCSAKCFVSGDVNVGGIAGCGKVITDCRSMVSLEGGEKVGTVMGTDDTVFGKAEEISGNFYLAVNGDIGAIDGISYTGSAEAKSQDEFFKLSGVPAEFRTVTVKFVFEDGESEILQMSHGSVLEKDMIPEIPEKNGYTGYWDGIENTDALKIDFDTAFYAKYDEKATVLAGEETDENGRPILFAHGIFESDARIVSKALLRELGAEQEYVAGRSFEIEGGTATALRFNIGSGYTDKALQVIIYDANGQSRTVSCRVEGSYAVFEVNEDDMAFAVMRQAQDYTVYIIAAAAAVVIIVLIIVLAVRKKKKKETVTV